MKVSLVLATLGRTVEVRRCLHSLIDQTDQSFEVLVVDQNQDSRLTPIIEEAIASGLSLCHLRMMEANLSQARNLGIAQATGDIIGFPDDDCWYDPDTIAEIRQAFIAKPALQGVVACWVEQAVRNGTAAANGSLSLKRWRCFRGGDASSISLFFRRELLNSMGGFDDRLGVGRWYGAAEETDFVLRSLTSGAQLDNYPKAKVHHAFAAAPQGNWREQCCNARSRARGTGAIYAKHCLSQMVILRGCTAPVVISLFKLHGFLSLLRAASTVVGRVEGLLRWGWGKS